MTGSGCAARVASPGPACCSRPPVDAALGRLAPAAPAPANNAALAPALGSPGSTRRRLPPMAAARRSPLTRFAPGATGSVPCDALDALEAADLSPRATVGDAAAAAKWEPASHSPAASRALQFEHLRARFPFKLPKILPISPNATPVAFVTVMRY